MTSSENMLTLAGAQVSGPEQQGTPRTQDKRSHLLPPLQHPSMQAAPPLHRLPGGDVTPERIVFTTATASCSPTMWVATTHVFPAVSQPKGSDVRQLWSCIQRIVPVRPAGLERKGRGFTLLLCHPVGLHKEIWEPTLEALVSSMEQTEGQQHVEEIWSMDLLDSGAAGVMNRDALHVVASSAAPTMDILQFLRFFLPPLSILHDLAVYGPRWLPGILPVQSQDAGKKGRTIIGIGHGMSGCALTKLAMAEADMLDGLIVIDPLRTEDDVMNKVQQTVYAPPSLLVADSDCAVDNLDQQATHKAWHPRVTALHARFGLTHTPVGPQPWTERLLRSLLDHQQLAGSRTDDQSRQSSRPIWCHALFTQSASALAPSAAQQRMVKIFTEMDFDYAVDDIQGGQMIIMQEPKRIGEKIADLILCRNGAASVSTRHAVHRLLKARM